MNRIASVFLLPFLATMTVEAKSLKLDMRAESDSTTYNEAAGNSNSQKFAVHTARIDYKGEVSEDLTYRFRLRLNNESATQGVDNLSSRIDYASVSHKLGLATLTFGKTVTEIGGHESVADSRDMYFKSEANKALTGTYNALSQADPVFFQSKYNTGFKAMYKLGSSDISLMVMNNPEGDNQNTSTPQTRLMQGVVWKGKFLEDSIQPILSYHTFGSNMDSPVSQSDTKTAVTSAGLKWTNETAYAQFDYVMLQAGQLNTGAGGDTDFGINSMILEGGYRFGDWGTRLKAELSKVAEEPTTGSKTEKDVTGYSVALEYHVPQMEMARYHLAWTQKTQSADNTKDKTEDHILAGIVIAHDFLK